MPSQLYDNDAISFICARTFVYAGEEYKLGAEFPQEKALNLETLVRTRYIVPVVEDWEDKPRHWNREVRLKSELMDKLTRVHGESVLNRAKQDKFERPADIEPGQFDEWEETEDNAAELHRKRNEAILKARKDKDNDMGKQEVTFVNGKEESEPVALLGLSPEEQEKAKVETKLVDEPEFEVSDDIQKLIDKKADNGGEFYNPDEDIEDKADHQGIIFDEKKYAAEKAAAKKAESKESDKK